MENLRGKGLSFARRIYRPRMIGLGIGSLCVFAALYPLAMPGWIWGLWLFNAFIWPHLAYQLSSHAAFPYQAERRNLLYDSLSGGFWAAATQFTPLTAVTILAMMTMHNVAAGGKQLMIQGLLNHGSWKDLLQLKFHTCQQQQSQATIALIDIDHFKQINDAYGHIVGDRVLRQLSKELLRNVRENDLAGRYGGDEFCVILPDVPLEQASYVMERLREMFSRYRDPQVPELRVSLSIGLAAYQVHFTQAHMWLNAADQALYAAKGTGRNRVTVAESRIARSA